MKLSDFKISYLILLLVVVPIIYNEYSKYEKTYMLYTVTKNFISKGERNTAANGITLCNRVNHLESLKGILPTDCCREYRSDSECQNLKKKEQ